MLPVELVDFFRKRIHKVVKRIYGTSFVYKYCRTVTGRGSRLFTCIRCAFTWIESLHNSSFQPPLMLSSFLINDWCQIIGKIVNVHNGTKIYRCWEIFMYDRPKWLLLQRPFSEAHQNWGPIPHPWKPISWGDGLIWTDHPTRWPTNYGDTLMQTKWIYSHSWRPSLI